MLETSTSQGRARRDRGADVDRDAFHLVADELHLAGVYARPDIEAEVADGADRSVGTGDRGRRAVERGEETVAGAPDLPAAGSAGPARSQRR